MPKTEGHRVIEFFTSIQGEGQFQGEPSVFLRLAGCPNKCKGCDTTDACSVENARVSFDEFAELTLMQQYARRLLTLVITGGEPALHSAEDGLVAQAIKLWYSVNSRARISIETSGNVRWKFHALLQDCHFTICLKPPSICEPNPKAILYNIVRLLEWGIEFEIKTVVETGLPDGGTDPVDRVKRQILWFEQVIRDLAYQTGLDLWYYVSTVHPWICSNVCGTDYLNEASRTIDLLYQVLSSTDTERYHYRPRISMQIHKLLQWR